MRIPTGNIPSQPLTFMWERHFEILRRTVAGERQIDIARSLNISLSRISIIVNSPLFQTHLLEMRKKANEKAADIHGRLSTLAIESMSVLENAIRQKDAQGISPAHRVKIAQDVLDRTGHGAIQKHHNKTELYDARKIEELKKRVKGTELKELPDAQRA